MAWNYRRLDDLLSIALGVWVTISSFVSPLRSQIRVGDQNTPLIDACLCSGDRTELLKLAAAVAVALLSGLSAAYARRRLWPLLVMAAIGWLLFSMWAAVPIASFFAGQRLGSRAAGTYLAVGPVLLVTPALAASFRGAYPLPVALTFSAMVLGLTVLAPFFYGRWVRARVGVHTAWQEARAEQARELERVRIAREMHDVVAHRVALMVLHAGALRLAARDERTRTTADLIRITGREALTELRQVLGVLRETAPITPQPTLTDVPALVVQTREAGVPVRLRVEGEAGALPSTVARTAYRIVQEGLTNVVKHAGLPDTEVLLRHGPHELTVAVSNGPPRKRDLQTLPGSGLGLVGLHERVELLGGSFTAAGRPDGGFTLRAELPTTLAPGTHEA